MNLERETFQYAVYWRDRDAKSRLRIRNAAPDLLAAARRSALSPHHPACPIPSGKGQTTITHDDCTCHVSLARAAIAKATGQEEG